MKVQIARKELKHDEVEIEFPIYALIEEDDTVCYAKLEQNRLSQIRIGRISTELISFLHNNQRIDEIWLSNQCSKEEWEGQLKRTQEFLSKF